MRTRPVAGSLFVFLAVSASWAQTPLSTAFTYQGRLKNAGSPANGLHDLRFRLYDTVSDGTQVGTTLCIDNVNVTDGLFSVPLDFGAQFAGQQRFLEIDVRADTGLGCSDAPGFVLLAPRQALTAAPNALFALNADLIDGLNSTAFLQSIPIPLTLSGTNAGAHIIRGENASPTDNAVGVFGSATGAGNITFGGRFESSSTAGIGVFGWDKSISGDTYGMYGRSDSPTGTGVFGLNSANTGSVCSGVIGRSDSPGGNGVIGQTTSTQGAGYGVIGTSNSPLGIGVYGVTNSFSGRNYGVYGQSNSASGFDFFAGGAGVDYGSGSSRRWKNSIEPIGNPLDKLSRLRGVYFNWDAAHGGRHDLGMIAEEVGAVLPEIVNYEENGVDAIGMDYSKMTPLLVEAVNALRAQKDAELAALRAEKDAQICEQQEKINELTARLERLEKAMSQTGHARKGTD